MTTVPLGLNAPDALEHIPFFRRHWGMFLATLAALAALSRLHFLLFHTLAELFISLVGIILAVVAWNTHAFSRNHFLFFLASGNFWISLIELLHTLAYKGMMTLTLASGHYSTQLWIGARFGEALLLLTSPLFLTRSCPRNLNILFGLLAAGLLGVIFTGHFPLTYVENRGLTVFKSASEVVIMILMTTAGGFLYHQRALLDPRLLRLLLWSIVFAVGAEGAFTFYVDLYGFVNSVGHLLKLASVWMIFEAVILIMLREPFHSLARGASSFDAIPDPVVLVDAEGRIHQANAKAQEAAGQTLGGVLDQSCHARFHPLDPPPDDCPLCRRIREGRPLASLEVFLPQTDRWFEFTLQPLQAGITCVGMIHVARDVTRRKKAEEALRHSQALLESIVENIPAMIVLKDARDLRFKRFNHAGEALLGFDRATLLGKSDRELFPPGQADFSIAKDREALESRTTVDIPEEFLRVHSGEERIFHTLKVGLYDSEGNPTHLLGISVDITEARRHEMESRWLASIFASSSDIMAVVDADWTYKAINDANLRYQNRTREEVIGKPVAEMLGREFFARELASYYARAFQGERIRTQVQVNFAGSGQRWLDVRYEPVRVANGRVHDILIQARDITDMKGLEQSLKEKKELLDRTQRIARLGSWRLDVVTGAVSWSDEMFRLLGLDHEQDHPSTTTMLHDLVHPEDREAVRAYQHRLVFDASAPSDLECRLLRPDGEERHIRISADRVMDASGRLVEILGALLDVTDRVRVEREKQLLQEQAMHSARLASLGTMAAGIAHEINNPNHIIMVNATLLNEAWADALPILDQYRKSQGTFSLGGVPYDEMRGQIAGLSVGVEENARRIAAIIEEVKRLARKPSASAHHPVDLNEVVDNALLVLHRRIAKLTDHFQTTLAPEPVILRGSPGQLEQVVINLVLNALQSLPDRSRGVFVAVSLNQTAGLASLTVRDQGGGILPEVMDHLGEPFFTTRQEKGGTGLGLSICQQILELHGGSLRFESPPEGGARVVVTLPLASSAPSPPPPPPETLSR
ncbi:MAG: PAS domain-containing protein [Magnetococcales bacterium]|nr:PAS domain-containing protein [Magnetococcales bacterium]